MGSQTCTILCFMGSQSCAILWPLLLLKKKFLRSVFVVKAFGHSPTVSDESLMFDVPK